ncbi:MAG: hypothetical protein COA78_20350 [Blastopirellula sp.]|nr:MAG: hypothetical protein COA78_20350 [Blastopirellula sp.]
MANFVYGNPPEEEVKSSSSFSYADTFPSYSGTEGEVQLEMAPWSGVEGPITKDVIKNTPALRSIVEESMRVRWGDSRDNFFLRGSKVDLDAKFDEVFEKWQNYNRSFAGGQSLTVAGEVAFHQSATEAQKATIGAGYGLFDAMPNIFSKGVSGMERLDAVGDYLNAAVLDPVNLIGLGLGKAAGTVGGKAAALTIRQGAKQAMRASLKAGATREAAWIAGRNAARVGTSKALFKTTAPMVSVDILAAVGADVGYQYGLVEGGQQKNYSGSQVALSALGALVVPAAIAGVRGVKFLGNTRGANKIGADNYLRLTEALADDMNKGHDHITRRVMEEIDTDNLTNELGVLLEDIFSHEGAYSERWLRDVKAGGELVRAKELGIGVDDYESMFWKALLLGDEDRGVKGLAQILVDSKFTYVPRGAGDNSANFIGDLISILPEDKVSRINRILQEQSPDYFSEMSRGTFKDLTSEELGLYFKKRASNLGRDLGTLGIWQKTVNAARRGTKVVTKLASGKGETSPTVVSLLEDIKPKKANHDTMDTLRWLQSGYKKLLTSHIGTTAVNVKGWALLEVAGTLTDVVEATLSGSIITKKGRAMYGGAGRRVFNLLNWSDTSEAAEDYLRLRPELDRKLHQYITGGVDANSTAADFGINPENKLAQTFDKTTDLLQRVSLVRMQDGITKNFSFISNLDFEIRRAHGMSFNEFFKQDNSFFKMFSPEFKELEQIALQRTLRTTASKPFSTGGTGSSPIRHAAKFIEKLSREPGIGALIPFGQFFNNSIATFGDYIGVNAIRHYMGRWAGQSIDVTEERGIRLIASGAVGLSLLFGLFKPDAERRLELGLRWNETERNKDGSVANSLWDFPIPFGQLLGYAFAYKEKYGEVPKDFREEAAAVVYGQTFRQIGGATGELNEIFQSMLTSSLEDASVFEIIGAVGSRLISGSTRSFDPLNQAVMMVTDSFENPDRRQGWKALNDSIRYFDAMLPVGPRERRFDPLTTDRPQQDIGRLLGSRSVRNRTTVDRMLASAGMSSWKQTDWGGNSAEMKNRLDELAGPIIAAYADSAMEKYPNFNDESLSFKERVIREQVFRPAIAATKELLTSDLDPDDPLMTRFLTISGKSELEVKRAMDFFGFEGSIEDLGMEEGGLDRLDIVVDYLENTNEYLKLP